MKNCTNDMIEQKAHRLQYLRMEKDAIVKEIDRKV